MASKKIARETLSAFAVLTAATALGAANSTNAKAATTATGSNNSVSANQAGKSLTQARQNVSNAQDEVSLASNQLSKDQEQLANTQQAAQQQKQIMTNSQQAADAAATAVQNAQQAVQSAQTAVKNSKADNIEATKTQISQQGKIIAADQAALQSARQNAQTAREQANQTTSVAPQSSTISQQEMNARDANAEQARNAANTVVKNNQQAAVDIKNKQTAVATAQANLATAQQSQQIAKEAVTIARKAQATAQQNVNKAQQEATAADQRVQADEQAVNDKQDAYQQGCQLAGTIKETQQAVSSATGSVAADNQAIQQQTTAVNNAQNAQTAAQGKLAAAQIAADTANKQASNAQALVSQHQQEVDKLSKARVIPSFSFTTAQKTTTQQFINEVAPIMRSGNFDSKSFYKLANYPAWQHAMSTKQSLNWQDSNAADQTTILDLDHLTLDQVNILSEFAAAIMNEIRQELGISGTVGTAVATSGMSGVAQEVATLYGERTDTTPHHYVYALKKAAFDHGLSRQDATTADKYTVLSNNLGESLLTSGSVNYTNHMTMAQAKENIAKAINDMLFNDSGSAMGHAMSMIGVYSILPDSQGRTNDYVGASISFNNINFNFGTNKSPRIYPSHLIHFMQYTGWEIDQNNAPAERAKQANLTQALNNGYESPAALTALSTAQANLANARDAFAQAQTAKQRAQQSLLNAWGDLQSAQVLYENAQEQLQTLQGQLKDDMATQSRAQARLTANQEALSKLTAGSAATAGNAATVAGLNPDDAVKSLADAFHDAQTSLQAAREDSYTKQAFLKAAQNDLQTATAALQEAQDVFSRSSIKVDAAQTALNNAKKELAAAAALLPNTQDDVTVNTQPAAISQLVEKTQQRLQADQNLLASLKAQLAAQAAANAQLQAAQQQLNKQQSRQQEKQAALEKSTAAYQQLQSQVASLQNQVAHDQERLSAAKLNLAAAQQRYQAADAASRSDAQKYGSQVQVAPITITVGGAVPEPQITNGTQKSTGGQAAQLFMVLATDPEAPLPAGTTAEWADPSQLQADAQKVGSYFENVLISFSDGSTTTIQTRLRVLAATASRAMEAIDDQQVADHNPATSAALTADEDTVPQFLAAPGRAARQPAPAGTPVTVAVPAARTAGLAVADASRPVLGRQQSANAPAQLPQTGNHRSAGIIILGLLTGMFSGLIGWQKQQN